MTKLRLFGSASVLAICALATGSPALAKAFDVPAGDLKGALDIYASQAGVLVVSSDAVNSVRSRGAKGDMSAPQALAEILRGTGFVADQTSPSQIEILKQHQPQTERSDVLQAAPIRVAAAAAGIESVVVTSSKIKGDIQTVPIAITALSQEQLTSRQIAGGPDLVKEVPNLTFSKTNFTGYNIQIRGIGTQAISVTTDPAVAVALNDIPFIRNHFFEQEFYDVGQVEVLRGPQGTLYGRNATAGVVNVITAKPTDQFEAMLSADIGNYTNRRYEGMVNIPIVDDRLDIRIAGEWTKRDGYTTNTLTGSQVDGRDLWSSRVTIGWKPAENFQATLVWEHFSEDDGRMRTAKQLCKTVQPPTFVDGIAVPAAGGLGPNATGNGAVTFGANYLSQSCQLTSLYSTDAFEVPYGPSLPYVEAAGADYALTQGEDPYVSTTQSRNLRVIETTIDPRYKAKNETVELNVDYDISPSLGVVSQTGYNQDFLWSTEDYNRFNTTPGIFGGTNVGAGLSSGNPQTALYWHPDRAIPGSYVFCDPQLGCSDRFVAQDLSDEHAWQLSQEFRLTSNFSGPFNFSIGGNYLHYETEENYYVFINGLTIFAASVNGTPNINPPGCLQLLDRFRGGYQNPNPIVGGGNPASNCSYVDPNPIGSLDNEGHNYFLSQNPYELNSYAGFGEVYYNIASDLKLTGGLRWTEDKKRFINIPSEVLTYGYGYYTTGTVNQQWDKMTGRAVANWTPKLDFTDQTLIYGSYSRGYKAGGANPPGAVFGELGSVDIGFPDHPKTFRPEFIDAFELGSKNTLLDGALTLNGDIFYYDYKDYQISEIVDRTSINLNFNAKVHGAELETTYEPLPGLKFSFAGGYEDTRIDNGQSAIDLMDRTAGMPGWMVVKPNITQASNCILPDYVVAALLQEADPATNGTNALNGSPGVAGAGTNACGFAYTLHLDPATLLPYTANPSGISPGYPTISGQYPIPAGYPGFDPTQPAINNGEGFSKQLGGNQLPGAPHFTTSLSADYTMPVSQDWAATLHSDFYWQSQSFARVFNDRPYDKIRGYSTTNLALILTSASGWQVMGYLKNVFNVTAITGDFLNSDDSGLTTNVFLTDPRLYGVRVTKNW